MAALETNPGALLTLASPRSLPAPTPVRARGWEPDSAPAPLPQWEERGSATQASGALQGLPQGPAALAAPEQSWGLVPSLQFPTVIPCYDRAPL